MIDHQDVLAAVGEPTGPEDTVEGLRSKLEKVTSAQSGSDKAYQAAKARVKELESQVASRKTEAELMARLAKVEATYKAKERKLSLDYYARSKALDAGVDYSLLEGYDFKDELQVEAKLAKLSEYTKAMADKQVNDRLVSTTPPQAGHEIRNAMTGRQPDQLASRIAKELRGLQN